MQNNNADVVSGSNLAQVKAQQLARADDEKLRLKRIKGVIVLIEQFLADQGYLQTLQVLQNESNVSFAAFCAADNIDLVSVVKEFEEYHEAKFQRKPRIFRTRETSNSNEKCNGLSEYMEQVYGKVGAEKMLGRRHPLPLSPSPHIPNGQRLSHQHTPTYSDVANENKNVNKVSGEDVQGAKSRVGHLCPAGALAKALVNQEGKLEHKGKDGKRQEGKKFIHNKNNDDGNHQSDNAITSSIQCQRLIVSAANSNESNNITNNGGNGGGGNNNNNNILCNEGKMRIRRENNGTNDTDNEDIFFGRALKPLPQFATSDLNDLASIILRDVLDVNPGVRWTDIAELDSAKHLLKEAVVMPVKYPELFEGIVRPWKGILLFGPPGTGKTLLAKAVATECRTTFFNISASSVVSKWRGDSEKLVRMLFDLAVHYAPSTIFIDEIDCLMSMRSGDGMEHEGSRRMKTELLVQMDGLSKRQGGDIVFVLAASNVPWDLDTAILRRLEKRVLVTLPTLHAREVMFRQLLKSRSAFHSESDWATCATLTDGMSGADIDVICREAMMRPIRTLIAQLESSTNTPSHLAQTPLVSPKVTLEDVKASIICTRSSVHQNDVAKINAWAAKYASGLST